MTIALHRPHPRFGAEVLGVELTGRMDGEAFGRILAAGRSPTSPTSTRRAG